jgi:hypothetical protein
VLARSLELKVMLHREKLLSNIGQLAKNYRQGPIPLRGRYRELTKTYEKSMDLGW